MCDLCTLLEEAVSIQLKKKVSPNSPTLWLNCKYLLSDTTEPALSSWDSNDTQTGTNEQNETLPSYLLFLLIKSIKEIVFQNTTENFEFRTDFLAWVQSFQVGLLKSYQHMTQAANQDIYIDQLKSSLQENEAILTQDYAMKLLPILQKFCNANIFWCFKIV